MQSVSVKVMRLSEFILDAVANRKIPQMSGTVPWKRPPTVLMKLDIEGTVCLMMKHSYWHWKQCATNPQ